MTIYKNRDVRGELLSKLEEFEPSSEFSEVMGWDGLHTHSDIYFKLYDIINNYGSRLPYIRDILLRIMNELMKSPRYGHDYKIHGLRLNILECRLQQKPIGTYLHQFLAIQDLPKFGCKNIESHIDDRNGFPDYTCESAFGNEWEIKIMIGNKICFTHSQLENFKKDVNILIYRKIEPYSYIHSLNDTCCQFHNHIKFSDIYDVLLGKRSYFQHKIGNKLLDNAPIIYQIKLEDPLDPLDPSENAKSIIKRRYVRESR